MFGALTAELGLDGEAIFHAIRHTVRTELGDLGVAKEISERILNHRNPAADISTRYDHGEYYREKYDALQAWERRLMGLLRDARFSGPATLGMKKWLNTKEGDPGH